MKINWKHFSAEQEIFRNISSLNEAIRAGMLKLTSKEEASESSLKKLQDSFAVQEWYDKDEAPHKFMYPMRTRMLVQLILSTQKHDNSIAPDPIKALGQMIKHYKEGCKVLNYSYTGYSELQYLLPHLKGHNYVLDYNGFKSVSASLLESYKELPLSQWVTLDNFITFLKYNRKTPRPVENYHAGRYLYYYSHYEESYKEKSYVGTKDYEQLISIPMVKASIALLASCGLLDIAYNTPIFPEGKDGHISYFEGIQALKLNPLGAYLLGLSKEYEIAQQAGEGTEVMLSSDDLMLLLSQEDKMKEKTLAFYSNQISPVRFHVTSATFLKDCKTKADLRERVANFKVIVGEQKLPPVWDNFFKDLLQKALTLEEVEEVVVYKLPEDNPNLLKLIATNPEFKGVIDKAEGYQVLVAKKQVRKFKSILSAAGYLLS